MEKSEYRAVIKFFVLKGLTTKEIYNELKEVLKEKAPSFPTTHRWASEFRRGGRVSVEDVPRTGRPKTVVTDEAINQVSEMIKKDSAVTENELGNALGISHGSVHEILANALGLKKISGKWEEEVPSCEASESMRDEHNEST